MQVPRGVDLGPGDGVHPVRRQGGDHAVVQDARGMHDAGQTWHVGQQPSEVRPVGDVAHGDGDLGAERSELVPELFGTGRGEPAPAGQQQGPDAVLGHQVAGDGRTQGAGTTGDEHRTGAAPDRGGGGGRCHGEPGGEDFSAPDGQLWLVGAERVGGQRGVVEVDEDEPVGVLGLRRTQQAPQRRVREVGHVLAGPDRDGVPGHHDQPGAREVFVGQPLLHQRQHCGRRGVRGGDRIGRARAPPVGDDEIGGLRALSDRAAQMGEVGVNGAVS